MASTTSPNMADKMDKLNEKFKNFIKDYDCTQYQMLPKFMKRRVDALKKIQLEHLQIEHQYNLELREIELKYHKLYQPLYDKRAKIISGEVEPTDEECQLPPNVEDEFNGDQENIDAETENLFTPKEEEALLPTVKGLPGFWLGCLSSSYVFNESIEDHDKRVLRYLQDIKLSYEKDGECLTYQLDFLFSPDNPYFTNEKLTKTYHLRLKPDDKDPFSYEGFEVHKSEGCEINWLPGKNVTQKAAADKKASSQSGKKGKRMVDRDSFFYFFTPPEVPKMDDDLDETLATLVGVDFEFGEIIRQSLIPKAPMYYIGYMMEEEDDEDDEDYSDYSEDDSRHTDPEEQSSGDCESSDY